MTPLLKRLPIPLAAIAAVLAVAAPAASASTNQISILKDNPAINAHPLQTFKELKAMGISEVEYTVSMADYSRDASSNSAPSGNMSSPAYWNFGPLEEIDTYAQSVGEKLLFQLDAPVPRWANHNANNEVNVSPADFQAFVTALGTQFSGHDGFQKVSSWSVWNEPNYVTLASPANSGTNYTAADDYRGLVNAAWNGLHASGHAGDTFLIGELAPRGIAGTAATNAVGSKPVTFMANVYCESSPGHRESGAMAKVNGCTQGSAFAKDNPGLFDATGVADHPYAQGTEPTVPTYDCSIYAPGKRHIEFCENPKTKKGDPLWTDLGQIGNLTSSMSRDLHAYGSGKQYPIYSTEYGYWDQAPGQLSCSAKYTSDCGESDAIGEYYDNWAEYVSYHNPRIVSFDQYQLVEPSGSNWTDGLTNSGYKNYPTFDPFEVPLFMPTTSAGHASNLTVWGDARPFSVDKTAKEVEIQFKGRSGGYKTIKTVTLSNAEGYFQTTAKFTASGTVRLVYGALISRTQAITVK